jgi:FKBP-type peptidyl-prolyl cis-trans isomerase FklB
MTLGVVLGMALLQICSAADAPAPATATTNAPTPSPFKDQKEKLSYALGMNIGSSLKRSGFEVDLDVLTDALKDATAGKEMKMTDPQAREAIMASQREVSQKRDEERRKTAEKNKKTGEEFLAQNKTKDSIKTHEVTLPDGTKAEMQYKIITEGTGAIPKSNDTVTVNYRGTLIDGKEFDSSAKHGPQPSKFQVNRVVRGWSEALQMMKTGSKWELYLPSTLGYGDFGNGAIIEPGSTLLFEVELVGVETPQPLTSDIIKVPSAEELKAGKKVEVLKPEDVEREIKNASKTNKP